MTPFPPPSRLYFITDSASSLGRANEEMVRRVVAGGVGIVQLREKRLDDAQLLEEARRLREVTRELEVLFIVNDRVDIARAVGADGVHVGQQDMSVALARSWLGSEAIIGGSAETPEQASAMELAGANYIANSLPLFPSPTKPDLPAVGLESIRRLRAAVTVPICAIGGITPDNVADVIAAGADLIAVISALTTAEDPTAVAREFVARMGPR
jgi:thiamine-phosphate pyrophosphorylase